MTQPNAEPEPGAEPGPGSKIRVLVADDQRVVRDGLVLLVGMLEGIEVVGAAGNGADAVELAGLLRPDVVLMDLDMPVLGGVAATELLRERLPDTAVLVLTTYANDDSVFPALRAGARGYLTKDADDDQVEAAIHNVHGGRTWLDPVVQARLVAAIQLDASAPVNSWVRQGSSPGPAAPLPDGLTPREGEVLTLIADGLSNSQICARLVVSQATVKTHINRIFTKIGVTDRAQAVRYAYRNNLPVDQP
ncbi:DNA-binding response regulator, NarL/FixJ family, contains REC and HTH domains [Actinacidiphila yanglinensis]|uniref:DNA-binding response regulator, NarL/FixJ family, contains REC and HTH domains n=1 Tax=Actinacidiphila yanglinensis TaxID=310779 RepID=A0A1H5Y3N3_9ACTN|nr:response regulator transcription factor [Actinacidiphila yanglinensis]SEG18601.1 DNA-binding response regulator, NarL/FixJ family, contains REC and HTH domains [Actinacidiphila yanglinensis]